PRCRSGAVGSKPAFTLRGLPDASERSSLARSSDSLTISAAPFLRYASCSSTDGKLDMRFDYNDPSCLLSFARAIPLRIVIPNKVRDLYFAAKLQIPHFVRDDNSGELRILDPVAGRSSARRLPVPACGSAVVHQTPLLDRISSRARLLPGSARAAISIPPAWPVSSRIHPASSRVDRETRSRHRFPLLPTDARLSRRR